MAGCDGQDRRPPVTALGSVAIGVMARDGGFRFDRRYYFDPHHRWQQDVRIARWSEDAYARYHLYNLEAHLVQPDHLPRPFRQVGGIQPNLILGMALGADLVAPGDLDPDLDRTPLSGGESIEELRTIDWAGREPIPTFLAQLDRLIADRRDDIDIVPPFFWDRSGRATVHGPLTTALKLMGDGFFIMLLEDPDRAALFLEWIADAYVRLITLFADRAELPVTGIHIGECSGCMVSHDDWERAILPVVNLLADACGAVRIHSCGRSDHLLEAMARVHDLAVFNIGSPTSVARSRELIGPEARIDVIPEARFFARGTPAELRAWVHRTVEENGDGPLEIQFHVDAGVPLANAFAIVDALRERGYDAYRASLVERWGLTRDQA